MKIVTKIRKALKPGHVKKQYKAGRNKSLDKLGSFTRQRAKKQFLNPKTLNQKGRPPKWRQIGKRDGIPVVDMTFRPPTPNRITSWKTGRGRAAKGFLRSSIIYERDDRRESVVIGPAERTVWLNKIHEFGGSRPVAFRYVGRYPKREVKVGGKSYDVEGGRAYVVQRRDAILGRKGKLPNHSVKPGKVRPAKYMATAIQQMRPIIPREFRGFIQGP
jgi:hypothetical protein